MRQQGRKSAASIGVVEGHFGKRPAPPSDLSAAQSAIWRAVVSSEPVDFFATAALRGLLSEYCRHQASADILSAEIDGFDREELRTAAGGRRYAALLQMRSVETKAMLLVARSLRLTNLSRYDKKTAATAAHNTSAGLKPWGE